MQLKIASLWTLYHILMQNTRYNECKNEFFGCTSKNASITKSGFPIVRRADGAAIRNSGFWLFPYPAIEKCWIAKEIAKNFLKKVVRCLLQRTPYPLQRRLKVI